MRLNVDMLFLYKLCLCNVGEHKVSACSSNNIDPVLIEGRMHEHIPRNQQYTREHIHINQRHIRFSSCHVQVIVLCPGNIHASTFCRGTRGCRYMTIHVHYYYTINIYGLLSMTKCASTFYHVLVMKESVIL